MFVVQQIIYRKNYFEKTFTQVTKCTLFQIVCTCTCTLYMYMYMYRESVYMLTVQKIIHTKPYPEDAYEQSLFVR